MNYYELNKYLKLFRKPDDFNRVAWDPINTTTPDSPLYYLKLDSSSGMMQEPFTERLKFWKSLGLEY